MTHDTPTTEAKRRPSPVAILLVPTLIALVIAIFAWPMASLEPNDLPVGVAGPPDATRAMEQHLVAAGDFDVERYTDAHAARDAIEERDVCGVLVATPDGQTTLMTASAASPRVSQMLRQATESERVHVEDVVPISSEGIALPSAIFPLLLAGTVTALAISMLGGGALRRTGLLLTSSTVVGLVAALMLQTWLGIVEGDWFANAAVLSLIVLAIGAFVAGLEALWGRAGYLTGALLMVFLANPWSGNSSAPELLPEPVGLIGQLMPVGAGGQALRSTGFFDGAAAGGPLLILTAWATIGVGALLLAGVRARKPYPVPIPQPA